MSEYWNQSIYNNFSFQYSWSREIIFGNRSGFSSSLFILNRWVYMMYGFDPYCTSGALFKSISPCLFLSVLVESLIFFLFLHIFLLYFVMFWFCLNYVTSSIYYNVDVLFEELFETYAFCHALNKVLCCPFSWVSVILILWY